MTNRAAVTFHHRGRRVAAGLSALVLAGALGTAATAAFGSDDAYTVTVSVVKPTVPIHNTYTVIAKGESANTSQLVIFINIVQKCQKTAVKDAAISTDVKTLVTHVTGAYTKSRLETAQHLGFHYACAYLRSVPPPTPVLFRARGGAVFHVISLTG
jgi:ABC-type transporter Mla maintaining outer membrane lipid asymmetry permease subunit MlaE